MYNVCIYINIIYTHYTYTHHTYTHIHKYVYIHIKIVVANYSQLASAIQLATTEMKKSEFAVCKMKYFYSEKQTQN